jgi:hypothetical protein
MKFAEVEKGIVVGVVISDPFFLKKLRGNFIRIPDNSSIDVGWRYGSDKFYPKEDDNELVLSIPIGPNESIEIEEDKVAHHIDEVLLYVKEMASQHQEVLRRLAQQQQAYIALWEQGEEIRRTITRSVELLANSQDIHNQKLQEGIDTYEG